VTLSLHGIGISGGYTIGRAQLYSHDRLEVPHYVIRKADVASEIARFDKAVTAARAECQQLRGQIPDGAPSELAAFLDLHAMILADSMLSQVPKDLIRSTACNAEWALAQQTEALLAQFDSIEDVYLRERRQDVKQVADKVLKALLGHPGQTPMKVSAEPTVLVAHDLSPSDMVIFKRHSYAGFITDLGGTTSHTAILARSLNISSVMALHSARALIQEGDVLIVDGISGVVIVNPDELILEEYQLRQNQWLLEQQKLKRLKSSPSATLDGDAIELLGNIDLPQDVAEALDENAAGIGLFRSEFLFMNRPDLPSEDEQFEAYRHVAAMMKGKPVVIRTLDVGADKTLVWLPTNVSVNPALGLRAIRLCLAEPRIFISQLRAILRASQYGQVRILIPMLASLAELDQSLELIAQAKAELEQEGQPFNPGIPIGGMIEVPAAALAAEWFARKLDFLSIGTNDLIQYTLAIDRTDDAVAHLYDPLHPAVIQLIAHTLKVGHRLKRPVSVCGEMAGDPKLTRLLLGMGLRSFSMHPAHLMAVKQQIMHSHVSSLTPLVAKLLKAGQPDRIQAYLERINTL
jgi:phosphotransferase system enzyme I (PtsI)